jgi:hypothetical protein
MHVVRERDYLPGVISGSTVVGIGRWPRWDRLRGGGREKREQVV